MKQLERLLFLQGNRCFLCQLPIAPGEASVEHLVATSNGGAKDDENCVVCCKAANAALGNLSIKAKFQAILNHRGTLACPHTPQTDIQNSGESPPAVNHERLALVVADLQKRGPARPRRVSTLNNTMNAVFKMQLSEPELFSLLSALVSKGYVAIHETSGQRPKG